MTRALLVTGTDTGVGKTLVSCALLRALARRGHRIGVYKPAETGVAEDGTGRLRGEDCTRLVDAARAGQPLDTVSTALYRIPAAPLVSAEAAGESIDPDALARDFEALRPGFDALWGEGAGGLLVPIAEGFCYADLAERLQLPVLLVVASRLGCLNHALLTLAELDRRGIPVVGSVLNQIEPESAAAHAVATNRDILARHSRHPDLGLMPFVPEAQRDDHDATARLAAEALDLAAVERVLGLIPSRA